MIKLTRTSNTVQKTPDLYPEMAITSPSFCVDISKLCAVRINKMRGVH